MVQIATFDLATRSGICFGRPQDVPTVEVIRAPGAGDDYGSFGAFYLKAFDRVIRRSAAQLEDGERFIVGFEAPVLPGPQWDPEKARMTVRTNLATTRKLHSLGIMLEGVCVLVAEDLGIEIIRREVNVKSAKRELAGHGAADKDDMVGAARRAGITLPPGDEAKDGADSFAVFLQAVRYWAPEHLDMWLRRLWGPGGPQLRLTAAQARRLL